MKWTQVVDEIEDSNCQPTEKKGSTIQRNNEVRQEVRPDHVFDNVLRQSMHEWNTVLGFKREGVLNYDPNSVEDGIVLKQKDGPVIWSTDLILNFQLSKGL